MVTLLRWRFLSHYTSTIMWWDFYNSLKLKKILCNLRFLSTSKGIRLEKIMQLCFAFRTDVCAVHQSVKGEDGEVPWTSSETDGLWSTNENNGPRQPPSKGWPAVLEWDTFLLTHWNGWCRQLALHHFHEQQFRYGNRMEVSTFFSVMHYLYWEAI